MTNSNVLFIMSDEHRPDAMGAAGHSLVRTPNLDALAAAGTRFSAAYTPSPVSLVDLYPTILECAGVGLGDGAASAGHSLIEIANGAVADRPVLSEFHDGGAPTGTFMLRRENWKYVHYVGERAQLFDLAGDPMEDADLGAAPEHAATRRELEGELRAIVDPEAANRRAFADQARRLAALGGREAVLAMSGVHFGYTPLGEATTG